MTDSLTVAHAIEHVANALWSLGTATWLFGWLFLLFKDMGGDKRTHFTPGGEE